MSAGGAAIARAELYVKSQINQGWRLTSYELVLSRTSQVELLQ